MVRPLVALLLAATLAMQMHLLHWHLTRTKLPTPLETVFVPPAPILEVLSCGYNRLVADALWLQVIQYYGGKLMARDGNMPNVWPFFDAITTLDPDFDEAYIFGSYVLADDIGRPDLALTLLERGRRHRNATGSPMDRPTSANAWEYPYQMGFVHYFYRNDKAEARRYFAMAAGVPGAAPVCARLAAALSEQVGERDAARHMWGIVYQTAKDPYTRSRAERNLVRLKVEDDLETLRKAIAAFQATNEHWPASLEELVQLEWLPAIPLDPNRQPYGYDALTGQVHASAALAQLIGNR